MYIQQTADHTEFSVYIRRLEGYDYIMYDIIIGLLSVAMCEESFQIHFLVSFQLIASRFVPVGVHLCGVYMDV